VRWRLRVREEAGRAYESEEDDESLLVLSGLGYNLVLGFITGWVWSGPA
jgi:hypothetical protein